MRGSMRDNEGNYHLKEFSLHKWSYPGLVKGEVDSRTYELELTHAFRNPKSQLGASMRQEEYKMATQIQGWSDLGKNLRVEYYLGAVGVIRHAGSIW